MNAWKILSLAALIAAPALLAGCNTVEGIGEDFAALGDTIAGESRAARGEPKPEAAEAE